MFRRIWKHLALLGLLIFINVMMFIYMDAEGARYYVEHEAPLYPMSLVPSLGAVVSLVLSIGLIVGIVQIMRRPPE